MNPIAGTQVYSYTHVHGDLVFRKTGMREVLRESAIKAADKLLDVILNSRGQPQAELWIEHTQRPTTHLRLMTSMELWTSLPIDITPKEKT